MLAVAVPAFAASTVNEKLSEYKISGGSSAKAGTVTFKVKERRRVPARARRHQDQDEGREAQDHQDDKAVETGSVGEVEVASGKTKSLKLKLKKGHYALICNIGDHYSEGMHKDFTVK